MNPLARPTAAAIVQALGQGLPDALLHELFPHLEVSLIRGELRAAAQLLAGAPDQEEPARPLPAATSPASPLRLYTDGASRGNPGEAGAGIQILDGHGREVYGGGVYLGQCTNNVAEYQALRLGLLEVAKLGGREVAIHLDSELIVRQIQGRYKVKDLKLKPLYDEVKRLLAGFDAYRISHVRREFNRRADELANAGIDRAGR